MRTFHVSRRLLLLLAILAVASPVIYYLASPLVISRQVSETSPAAVSQTIATGIFTDADSFHKTSGTAKVLQFADASRVLRLEGFRTTNGPDLFVYLSADKQAREFVNLGGLKGNIGDQNYDIPASADLARYKFVLIYCRAFSTLFGSAELF